MSEYDNNMAGALFKNEKKAKDTDPAYKGTAEVDGVEYWLSSWINTSERGVTYMKLSFTKKDEQESQEKTPAVSEADMPF